MVGTNRGGVGASVAERTCASEQLSLAERMPAVDSYGLERSIGKNIVQQGRVKCVFGRWEGKGKARPRIWTIPATNTT